MTEAENIQNQLNRLTSSYQEEAQRRAAWGKNEFRTWSDGYNDTIRITQQRLAEAKGQEELLKQEEYNKNHPLEVLQNQLNNEINTLTRIQQTSSVALGRAPGALQDLQNAIQEQLKNVDFAKAAIFKFMTPPAPEKIIPNNEIIGPDLVPQTVNPGQVNKIPLLPIAAGVGVIILAVALSKRRKR